MPRTKKRDWFDYVGPAIGAMMVAALSLVANRSCSTHDVVSKLTNTDFPLLSKDVDQTKSTVNGLTTQLASVQKDVNDAKGQMVTKSELEQKNQGLQQQFQRVYESQSGLKDKISDLAVEQAKVNAKVFIPDDKK